MFQNEKMRLIDFVKNYQYFMIFVTFRYLENLYLGKVL